MMSFMKSVSDKLKQTAAEVKKEVSNLSATNVVNSKEIDLQGKEIPEEHRALVHILKSQDELLDSILKEQDRMYRNVKLRKWDALQKSISSMRVLSDSFVSLDQQREAIAGEDKRIYFVPCIEPLFSSVRSKLTRSKIENEALNSYVGATRDFISNIMEDCYTNNGVCYGQNGRMINSEMGSMIVNTEF